METIAIVKPETKALNVVESLFSFWSNEGQSWESFRDALLSDDLKTIDRNDPVFLWGLQKICNLVDSYKEFNGSINKEEEQEITNRNAAMILEVEQDIDLVWPQVIIDAAKQIQPKRYGIHEEEWAEINFTLRIILECKRSIQ